MKTEVTIVFEENDNLIDVTIKQNDRVYTAYTVKKAALHFTLPVYIDNMLKHLDQLMSIVIKCLPRGGG